MSPRPPAPDIAYERFANSIRFGNGSGCSCVRPDGKDMGLGKLGAGMRFPRHHMASTISSLLHHVRGIVCRGAKKQMMGINARRVVTTVTNKKTLRDGTVVDFVRFPMSVDVLTSATRDAPVISGPSNATPNPADLLRQRRHAFPKGGSSIALPVLALPRSIARPTAKERCGFTSAERVERFAANATIGGDFWVSAHGYIMPENTQLVKDMRLCGKP